MFTDYRQGKKEALVAEVAVFARKRVGPEVAAVTEAAIGIGYEALRFLTDQQLVHTPINYAMAYMLKQDRFGFIAMTVDAILMDGRMVMQADADRIMAEQATLVSRPGEKPIDKRQEMLRHQTLKVADLTAGAAANSSEFGRDLSDGLHHLSGGAASIEQIVGAMIERTRKVETQLRAASKEIETLRQEVEIVRDDAARDALTGLLNRRGATDELRPRRQDQLGTIALCDVDHFKVINDRFGHAVGDRVLKGVAASLAESCDIHQVARWGGEEFLIILDGLDPDQAFKVLERARTDLASRTFRVHETEEPVGRVTISIGAASLQSVQADAAIKAADRLLYEAKRAGRNRLVASAQT